MGTHPILWSALRGSTAAMVTSGALVRTHHASAVVVVLTGLFGTIRFDWLYWWAGRRWGAWWIDLIVQGRPRFARAMRFFQARIDGRWAIPLMLVSQLPPLPAFLIYAAAGWGGMSLAWFLVLDVFAGLIWVVLVEALGYEIGQPAISVTREISHYGLYLGIAIAVVIVVNATRRSRAGRARPLP